MKKVLLMSAFVLVSFFSQAQKYQSFGKKITTKEAKEASSISSQAVGKEAVAMKVVGEVESVCPMAGCWMKVKLANGETMRVTFKDYGFFVPKDIAGQKVIFEGMAKQKVVSVSDQKHYAEDAGVSRAEIDKIDSDKIELTFVADGVLVPKK
ncbi:MAG: DUF4920 domain-containing protein [Spirosomataceae bacterium]